MQPLLMFIAEFQTAKSRFRKKFELPDGGGISQENNEDAQGREERLSIFTPSKSYSMYENRETTAHGVLPGTDRNQKRAR